MRLAVLLLYCSSYGYALPPTHIHITQFQSHNLTACRRGSVLGYDGAPVELTYGGGHVTVYGSLVGRTQLEIATPADNGSIDCNREQIQHIIVDVVRGEQAIQIAFKFVLAALIVVANLMMGTQLDIAIIKTELRRPVAVAIGFACQYLLMPMIAFGLGISLLGESAGQFLGFFVIGCSPGGGTSNYWTVLLDGSLNLSVTMTFLSSMASIAMMPFWLLAICQPLFLPLISSNTTNSIRIPFRDLILTLLLLFVPLLIGYLLARKWPQLTEKISPLLKGVMFVIIFVVATFGAYANRYAFQIATWRVYVCCIALPYTGFAVAYFLARLLGRNERDCRTIAIETGIQSAAIAVMLLQVSLPQPDADLAAVAPIVGVLFTPIPLAVAFGVKLCHTQYVVVRTSEDIYDKEGNS